MVIAMPLTSHKTNLLAFILGVLLIAPLSVFAKVGEITKQIGQDGSIARDKEVIITNEGIGINMNDTITTSKAKLQLTFEDNTEVNITQQSKLIIDDFVYDPSAGTGKLAMNIAMGTVRYASGGIAKNSRAGVKIRTPTATIGVRGTDFTMTVDEIGRSLVILLPTCPTPTTCYTGEIEVSTDAGSVILNKAFQATVASSLDSKPTKPKILDILERNIDNMLIISPPKDQLKIDPVLPNIHQFKSYIQYSYNEEGIFLFAERPPHVAQVRMERYVYGYVNIQQDGILAPLQINDGGSDVVINITQSN